MDYKYFAAMRLKKSTIAAIVLTILSLPLTGVRNSSLAQDQIHPNYEVYALSYGVYPNFPVSALMAGADKDRKIDLQMMIWLVKGPGGKNILVDTGCYRENVVKGKGIKDLIKASDAIAKLGLSAADITDVVITHMHWDHADGMDLFPNAKICPERRVRLLHRRSVAGGRKIRRH
jgi:glyoxylase-like metal-dependent hydrolase (beta-lactamase superfamily II)